MGQPLDGPEEGIAGYLSSMKQQKSNWNQSAVERGQVNGIPFVRVRFNCVDTSSGRALRGFVYCGTVDRDLVLSSSHDFEGHSALTITEAAALTIRKK
jgi:hypothetical protein